MPLDDREQRILEEIERQFYEDDPKLAETVRTATLASLSGKHLKWALVGLVVGAALMFGFFTRYTAIALLGFGVMVVSVAGIDVDRQDARGGRSGSGSGCPGRAAKALAEPLGSVVLRVTRRRGPISGPSTRKGWKVGIVHGSAGVPSDRVHPASAPLLGPRGPRTTFPPGDGRPPRSAPSLLVP